MATDRTPRDIPSLTGLRGVAALMIVIAHFAQWCAITPLDAMPPQILQWTNFSNIGMPIFFTLSGFVIALSYSDWDWRERPAFNIIRLFFYRFARLYPAFFLFAVLIVLRNPPLRDLSDPATQDYLWPHFLLWQTWWPMRFGGVVAMEDAFSVSWSLSTECGLYLIFGLGAVLIALLPDGRHKSIILGVGFFAATWAAVDLGWAFRGYLMPTNWNEWDWGRWLFHLSPLAVALQFGIGVMAYHISRLPAAARAMRAASDAGGICMVVICLLVVLRAPISPMLFVSIATAMLMIGAQSNSMPNRLLSRRGIVFIGTISYSLYLFHVLAPGMVFKDQVASFDGGAAAYYVASLLISLALAVFVATGIYRLVEVPGRRAIRSAADRLLGIQRDRCFATTRLACAPIAEPTPSRGLRARRQADRATS
jgi:peptidoglycan/LPS O-acetylase OafA/YrhL